MNENSKRTKTTYSELHKVGDIVTSFTAISRKNIAQVYGKNQAGRGKAKHLGFLPLTYLVFWTTSTFLAWLGITIYVEKL